MNAKLENDNNIDPVSKRLCIVQLNRIGDIIQTTQAVNELKKFLPEIKVDLVCRSTFGKGLAFLLKESFDNVYYYDQYLFEGSENLNDAKDKVNQFIDNVGKNKIDVLVNLSFSKVSNYLSKVIPSDNKVGPFINERHELSIPDKWSKYLYSSVMTGPLNPFSLVDLFKYIIGLRDISQVETKERNEVKKIVLHPFSSHAKKNWKMSKWTEIIYKVLNDNKSLSIDIVGSKDDINEVNKILTSSILDRHKDRITSHVGNKSIEEVYKIFSTNTLFVGHDSMVGHLATLAGTQSFTISLGTVRVSETTPYGDGNYVLSPRTKCFPCFPDEHCELYQCHSDISYQITSECINQLIKNRSIEFNELKKHVSNFHIDTINIHKTELNQNNVMLKTISVTNQNESALDIVKEVYKVLWQFSINDVEMGTKFPQVTARTHEELLNVISGIKYIYELCEFGKKYSQYILEEISKSTPQIKTIKEHSHKIDEVDKLLNDIKATYPILNPIVNFLNITKGNLIGDNIVQLSESSFYAYQETSAHCSILFELIENSIQNYKVNNKASISK